MPDKVDELVAANHILAREKVLDAYGHVSVRDVDNPDRYFVSRSLAPELVTAEDVLSLDVASSSPHTIDDRPLYLERFIHGSIYKARTDVNAVVHSHFSLSNTIWNSLQCANETRISHELFPSCRSADLRNSP